MNHFRGILMLMAAAYALYRGWRLHTGEVSVMAYCLGVLALGLAIWHLTRKAPQRRIYGQPNPSEAEAGETKH
jgi:hypothetical protein